MLSKDKKSKKHRENKKIEVTLTESGIILRLIFMVVALIAASVAFYNIFTRVLHTNSGWQTISAGNKSTVGSDFTFYYQIGVSGTSASSEWARLNKLYPVLLNQGADIFGNDEIAGVGNLFELNTHPNEEVYLEPELYEALKKTEEYNSRFLYFAPVFAQYSALFSCADEYSAMFFDPFENADIAKYLQELCAFVNSEDHIKIVLLGDNKAKLVVSEEYLAYAKENEIDKFLDFYYLENAFIIDYVADKLIADGYTAGVLTCTEGFARALGTGTYTYRYYSYGEKDIPEQREYQYEGPKNIVSLRDFQIYSGETGYYYQGTDGRIRHIFVDPKTGLSREGTHHLVATSDKLGCSDIFMLIYDAFVQGEETVKAIEASDISFVTQQ